MPKAQQAEGFCGIGPPARPQAQRISVPRDSSHGGSSSSRSPPGTPVASANLVGCFFGPNSACGSGSGAPPVSSSRRQQGGSSKGITPGEMDALLDRMKTDIMLEMRRELSELSGAILGSNRQLITNLNKLSTDVQALQDESKRRPQAPQSPAARLVTSCVQRICGGGDRSAAEMIASSGARPSAEISVVAEEPEPSQMPRSDVMSPRYSRHQVQKEAAGAPRASGPGAIEAASVASSQALRRQVSSSGSMVAPVNAKLQLAVQPPGGLLAGEATEVAREPFVQSLEALSQALNKLGGNMGDYLQNNVTKLKNSKADNTQTGYKEWLLTELPVHGANGYKSYVDDSAWMANLWIGWTMEFFVEFFALLHQGKDTKASVDGAYKKTLYNHHNFFQRTTFSAAVMQLPQRDKLIKSLRGSASEEETLKEIGEFVDLGRPVVKFCMKTNDMLDQRLQAQRKAKK